jgi:hypothetical protein
MLENIFWWLSAPAGAALTAYKGLIRCEIAEGCSTVSEIVFPYLDFEDGNGRTARLRCLGKPLMVRRSSSRHIAFLLRTRPGTLAAPRGGAPLFPGFRLYQEEQD